MMDLHLFCDFDGTITSHDTLVYLATHLGAGEDYVRQVGEEIRHGRMSLRDAIADEMRGIRISFEEAAQILRREVSLDPGFTALADWSRENGVPFTILSAGFHEIIDLFIPPGDYPWVKVIANRLEPSTEHGWICHFMDQGPYGHDKRKTLREARERGDYLLFVGDGLSDQKAAEEADLVFAKHSLAAFCRENAIDCHEYRTLADVRDRLEDLRASLTGEAG